VTRFSQTLPTFHENERFSQKVSMRNRQKAVPLGKISNCFTFFSVLNISRIPEFRILEFWNSGILEFCKWQILRKKWYPYFHLNIGHFQNSRIPGSSGFWNSGILEFWNSRILELFWNSGILEFWNSGILEFWKWPI